MNYFYFVATVIAISITLSLFPLHTHDSIKTSFAFEISNTTSVSPMNCLMHPELPFCEQETNPHNPIKYCYSPNGCPCRDDPTALCPQSIPESAFLNENQTMNITKGVRGE